MKLFYSLLLFNLLLWNSTIFSQTISSSVPKKIIKSEKYLFYLHGGVVTALGNNAINQSAPAWGPYEYLNILDSLQKQGFNVISENRKEAIEDAFYVDKISKQIDSLIKGGVKPGNILVVGASSGSSIVINISSKLKNNKIKYVIMGACWPETFKEYLNIELYGRFLSIIESSDPHGTCYAIFDGRKHIAGIKEIVLHTGLSHGFLYKGYKEWINPIINWFEETN